MKVMQESVIAAACAMHTDQLTVANSGNISVRYQQGFLITPSGVPYEQLKPADIVWLDMNGQVLQGQLKPSSEWRIHRDIYQEKTDVNAIVHAHAESATALSVTRKPLPAFHYMVALFGGYQVPCAGYATFGTQALSAEVLQALQGYSACLMANHGMIVTGSTLAKTYTRALELESLCTQYLKAKALGDVYLLSDQQMQEARQAFAGYGSYDSNSTAIA